MYVLFTVVSPLLLARLSVFVVMDQDSSFPSPHLVSPLYSPNKYTHLHCAQ